MEQTLPTIFQEEEHNVSGDNGQSKWISYHAMDSMFNTTAIINGIPGANDHGAPVVGAEVASLDVDDDDALDGDASNAAVPASNLPGVLGAVVKRRRINGDIASALDQFIDSFAHIK